MTVTALEEEYSTIVQIIQKFEISKSEDVKQWLKSLQQMWKSVSHPWDVSLIFFQFPPFY